MVRDHEPCSLGEPNEAPYSGTKGAVIAFSKSIARPYGPWGIRVNVVCPRMTVPTGDKMKGGMWAKASISEEQIGRAVKWYPLQKVGKPEDIANAVVFLASDRAGHITGQTLSVSGGYTMM